MVTESIKDLHCTKRISKDSSNDFGRIISQDLVENVLCMKGGWCKLENSMEMPGYMWKTGREHIKLHLVLKLDFL